MTLMVTPGDIFTAALVVVALGLLAVGRWRLRA